MMQGTSRPAATGSTRKTASWVRAIGRLKLSGVDRAQRAGGDQSHISAGASLSTRGGALADGPPADRRSGRWIAHGGFGQTATHAPRRILDSRDRPDGDGVGVVLLIACAESRQPAARAPPRVDVVSIRLRHGREPRRRSVRQLLTGQCLARSAAWWASRCLVERSRPWMVSERTARRHAWTAPDLRTEGAFRAVALLTAICSLRAALRRRRRDHGAPEPSGQSVAPAAFDRPAPSSPCRWRSR